MLTTTAPAQPSTATGFGELLRTWRQARRLSQLELALAADVSTRHLSCLETGRANPSPEMVVHLAERLQVPLRERNAMLTAAGFAPRYPAAALDSAEMASVRAALHRLLDAHEPWPALAVDRHWNVVAANEAAILFVELADPALQVAPLNVARLALHPDGLSRFVPDQRAHRSHLLHRLRAQVEATRDPVLADLLAEVSGYGDGADADDVAPTLVDQMVLPLRLRVDGTDLAMLSTMTVFGAPRSVTLDELAIETFLPADDVTASWLRRRAESDRS